MHHSSNWLKIPAPKPAACSVLVSFPFAGGGTSIYRGWPAALPADVELVCVELPGRESRLGEPPLTDLDAVITILKAALPPVLAGRRHAFFGHSLGALLAFELARAMRRDGHPEPMCLFASGREAPTRRERGRDLHVLSDADFVDEMVTRYDGIPQLLRDEPELLALFLPAMKADLQLTETYVYRPDAPFEFPIHILAGATDRRLTLDLLRPWGQQTTEPAPLKIFPGGHFFIRDSRLAVTSYVHDVLTNMSVAIDQCRKVPCREMSHQPVSD